MPATTRFVCSACRWWHVPPADDANPATAPTVGYCRRFPPARGENGVGAWPITFGHDWCGEFAENTELARQASRGAAAAH